MWLEWKIEGQNQQWAVVTDEYPEDLPVEHTKDTLLSKPCLCKVDILVTVAIDLIVYIP